MFMVVQIKYPQVFSQTDFKYVDGQPQRHLLKGLKVCAAVRVVILLLVDKKT